MICERFRAARLGAAYILACLVIGGFVPQASAQTLLFEQMLKKNQAVLQTATPFQNNDGTVPLGASIPVRFSS